MARLLLLAALTIALLATGAARGLAGDDDDPVVAKKKTSEWRMLLEKGDKTDLRRAGAIALGIAGPKVPGVVAALNKALREDKEPAVRREAAQALKSMAKDPAAAAAMEYLVDALKDDKDGDVRMVAAAALGRMEARPALQVLIAAVKDPYAGTRAAAAEALAVFGTDARDAIPSLVAALLDPKNDRFVRAYAAISLRKVGGDAETAVPALIKVLGEDVPSEMREILIEVVGQYGEDAAPAAEPLTRLLKDPQLAIRRKAAAALGQIGPEARTALPNLREMLKKETDKPLVCYTLRTLGGLGKNAKTAVSDMADKCRAEHPLEIRLAAIEALGNIGPDAREAIPALQQARKDTRSDVRDAATAALKKIQDMP